MTLRGAFLSPYAYLYSLMESQFSGIDALEMIEVPVLVTSL